MSTNTTESNVVTIQSPTQIKEAGKILHNTPAYALNPHKAIVDFVTPYLHECNVGTAKILVATFRQPDKTAGGLLKTERYKEEDIFQGIAGLVIKVGPLAFSDDAKVKFGGFKAEQFEWVIYKPESGRATNLRGLHCRVIEDVCVDMIVTDPELFW